MATILAHIRVKPGAEKTFEAIAARLYDATHKNESAVRQYEYWRGAEPRTYYTVLSFDDYRGFLDHQSSPHHEAEAHAIGDCVEELMLEWVDPIGSASPLEHTDHQDAPADANEIVQRYAETHAAQVQDWWLELR